MALHVRPDLPRLIVMDTFDLMRAIELLCAEFGVRIKSRSAPVVIRPDSGVPESIVPRVLEKLYELFGGTSNAMNFKVLHPSVRVIQGDGISVDGLRKIVDAVVAAGFSLENILFGSGGGLLQSATRDTLKFAYKASAE